MRRFRTRVLIAVSILAVCHLYIWSRLVVPLALPSGLHALATAVVVALAPALPLGVFGTRGMSRERGKLLRLSAYIGFGFSVYLFLAAIVAHVAVLAGANPRLSALVGTGAAIAVVLGGLANVARGPIVKAVTVPLAKLPESGVGYRIVQLTDVHIGPMLDGKFAAEVVRRVNALAPDLVVITGDLCDGRFEEMRSHMSPLRDLRARDGVYACTGNHEYYWEMPQWMAELRSLGVKVLHNAHVTINDSFVLAGVDDSSVSEDVPGALAGRDPNLPVVLLAHHPSTLPRAQAEGVDLQLSGHTHGGQLLPFGWLIRLWEPLAAGLKKFGSTWLYVSQGTGFWGPPLRVGTSSEIALITLSQA